LGNGVVAANTGLAEIGRFFRNGGGRLTLAWSHEASYIAPANKRQDCVTRANRTLAGDEAVFRFIFFIRRLSLP
jgi:hypothetical protein